MVNKNKGKTGMQVIWSKSHDLSVSGIFYSSALAKKGAEGKAAQALESAIIGEAGLCGVDEIVIAGWFFSHPHWDHIGGFIPFCDHRCPPDVKEETYLYYLDLKKELFGLK